MNGFLIINKPAGITSHDVVDHVRKLIPEKAEPRGRRRRLYAVGHAGTLDPFATGVLLVAIGKTARLLEYTRDFQKTYLAEFILGATSDTDDITGAITRTRNTPGVATTLEVKEVRAALKHFLGPIQQIPPVYSAVKVKGRKLYEYARAGDRVEHPPRPVNIYSIKLIFYKYPILKLEITCGSGTFIRSLARDLGDKLGVGGYVSHLERISIHKFHISAALTLSKLSTVILTAALLPSEKLIEHLPSITLSPADVVKYRQGRAIRATNLPLAQSVAVFDEQNHLLGIGHFDPVTHLLHPKKVL